MKHIATLTKITFWHRNLLFVLFACALILSFTPLALLSLLIGIFAWVFFLPFPRQINTVLLRYVVAFIVFTASLQLLGVLFWFFETPLSTFAVILILFIPPIFLRLLKRGKNLPIKIISGDDITSLLITLCSGAILAFGIWMGGGNSSINALRSITVGFDDSQHVSMSLSLLDNKGYIYGPANEIKEKMIYDNRAGYPLGWHLSNAVWWDATNLDINGKKQPLLVTNIYLITKLIWYCLAVFLLCRSILFLLSLAFKERTSGGEKIGALLFTIFAQVLFLVSIFKFGFGNYLPVFSYLLVLLILIASYLSEEKPKDGIKTFLITSLIIAGGLSFTWLLVAPVAYLAIAITYLQKNEDKPWAQARWFITRPFFTLSLLLLVVAGSIQGIFQLKYSVVADNINLDGGIGYLNTQIILVGIVATIILLAISKKGFQALSSSLVALLSSSLLMTGFIFMYQLLSVGRLSYYFTKVGFVALMFAVIAIAVCVCSFMRKNTINSMTQIFLATSICIGLLFTTQADLSYLKYAIGQHKALSYTAAETTTNLLKDHDISSGNFVMFTQQNYDEDLMTTQYVTMLARTYNTCQQDVVFGILDGRHDQLVHKTIPRCAASNSTPWYIVTSDKNYTYLKDLYANQKQIHVLRNE